MGMERQSLALRVDFKHTLVKKHHRGHDLDLLKEGFNDPLWDLRPYYLQETFPFMVLSRS